MLNKRDKKICGRKVIAFLCSTPEWVEWMTSFLKVNS